MKLSTPILALLATGVIATPLISYDDQPSESYLQAADDQPSESYLQAADALSRLKERTGPSCAEFGERCGLRALKICCRLLICIGARCREPIPKA
ncbi:hypothetical protein CGRA01v4_03863 [Colletotrichum graminicola]|nr:hypothetical protein CGRA01v4_03863 [Colletotrichum graminicola]